MDDDDAEYMQGSDGEEVKSTINGRSWNNPYMFCCQDYDFNYSDDDVADDTGAVDLENLYYTAKCKPLLLP